MESNQILAALQIEENEIRIVVGEFYRDLFNIITRESIPCKGISEMRIVDEKTVINSIREISNTVSATMGTPLEKVLLCIPGYRAKKEKKNFDVLLPGRVVNYSDISNIFKDSYKVNVGNDYEIINAACAYYKINGIIYPKMPIGEKSEMLSTEVDLICGDRLMTYDYVSVVEKAGLSVIDICQDGFASCKEAALFEQSFNNYVIDIYLEASHTVFSLIYNGRLFSNITVNTGYDELIKPIMTTYSLNYNDARRLLFRYGVFDKPTGEDRIINRWGSKNDPHTITYNDLQKTMFESCEKMVNDFYSCCSSIIQQEHVSIVITGYGSSLQDLDKVLTEKFQKTAKAYCPDMLGVRESKWAALLGMFYVYKDNKMVRNTNVNSVDMEIYKANLIYKEDESVDDGLIDKIKTFTGKIFTEQSDDRGE